MSYTHNHVLTNLPLRRRDLSALPPLRLLGAMAAALYYRWPWEIFVVFISNSGQTVALWKQKARQDVVVWDYHVVLILSPGTRPPIQDPGGPAPLARTQVAAECGAWVYDFDTVLPSPCGWLDYISGTFPYAFDVARAARLDEAYRSLFRIVPAEVYLDHFASDRSHMLAPGTEHSEGHTPDAQEARFRSPPPPYPAICGRRARQMGVKHNLMEAFVQMSESECVPAPRAALRGGEGAVGPEEGKGEDGYGKVLDMERFLKWISGGIDEE
ncbi:Protein N-terminal glutamine amidohydrolase [Grifola frondosa]|uniref:Protein N-terminal glutamine amidohydrolase n=1 Tax=Grifola frondosa TaxID=5627 RepID=A0A1C7MEN1_GRIFR|nr:Protein N-terminal glutamine amidohydrolase [Grifola frondosa]